MRPMGGAGEMALKKTADDPGQRDAQQACPPQQQRRRQHQPHRHRQHSQFYGRSDLVHAPQVDGPPVGVDIEHGRNERHRPRQPGHRPGEVRVDGGLAPNQVFDQERAPNSKREKQGDRQITVQFPRRHQQLP
jgi:hypothetical protein